MNKEQAAKKIAELTAQAEQAFRDAEALADKHELEFSFSLASMLKATVQYSVHGYVAFNRDFEAKTVTDLIVEINDATAKFLENVALSDEADGDLRAYTPEFGDGYPSLGGFGPEFGEEINGCLTGFSQDGVELDYNSVKYTTLREKTSLS